MFLITVFEFPTFKEPKTKRCKTLNPNMFPTPSLPYLQVRRESRLQRYDYFFNYSMIKRKKVELKEKCAEIFGSFGRNC